MQVRNDGYVGRVEKGELGRTVGDTVMYLSLKALGFVVDDEGSEFVTLKT